MLNCCMRGCSKAVGLAALSFCAGVIAGAFLPMAIIAVIEIDVYKRQALYKS